jgi:hypothetical protein
VPLVLVSCGLILATLAVAVGPAAASATVVRAPAPCAAQAPTETAALAEAARCKGRVEVAAARSETDTVWANPTGTVTLERAIVPRRVRQAGGGWAAVDTSLVPASDGGLQPRSTTAKVHFSAGGRGPVATMASPRGTVRLSWPTALPSPRADGDTAVYSDVLPDVDLRVRAVVTGFTYVLVVKTRAAAANPALRTLRLPFSSDKLTMRNSRGGVQAVDRAGKVVFASGAASMWDSGTGTATSDTVADAVAGRIRGRTGAPVTSTPNEAGELARTARVGARMSGGAWELTPDADMLTSPYTVFPLFIDPPVSYLAWAYADTGNWDNMTWGEVWAGLNPADGAVYRGYFVFGIGDLAGRTILGATFSVLLKHTWSCSQTATTLVRTDDPSDYRTDFAPAERAYIDQPFWANAHKISNGVPVCSDDPQPSVTLSWGGNLASEVQGMAPSGTITLSVTAGSYNEDESAQSNWRKFDATTAVLDVTANALPSVTGMSTSPGMPCTTGSGRPHVTSIPHLSAVVSDPEGGQVKAKYEWSAVGGSVIGSTVTGMGASGSTLPPAIIPPGDLAEGGTYSWHVQAGDAYDWGGWSGSCEFTVDTLVPTSLDTSPPSSCVSTSSGTDTASLPRLNSSNGGAGLVLTGVVDDLNGGTVQAQFEWWPKATRGSSGMIGTATTSPAVASHSTITTTVAAAAFADGSAYSWRMRGIANGVNKAWSPWCEFVVDTTAPGSPTVSPGPDNDLLLAAPGTTPGTPGSNAIIGRPTRVTLVPAGGTDPDVVGYLWGINTASPQRWAPAAANGTAVVTVEPIASGLTTNKLTVVAVDRAGNRSPLPSPYTSAFKAQASVATGWWPTNDAASPLHDVLTTNSHPLTVSGSPVVGRGVINVNGSGDAATSAAVAGPVVTNASFTVAAWARINGTSDWQAIVSQDASVVSGFYLQYQQASGKFRFSVPTTDSSNPVLIEAYSTSTVQLGQWYHLVGVYDQPNAQLRLYVNGVLNATAAWAGPAISATGSLRIGRLKYNGGLVNWLTGDVADVRTWNKPLDPTGIAALAKLPPSAGQWGMEDVSSATASDGSGLMTGHPAALAGAYSPVAGHTGTALRVDGVTGAAATTGPVIATNTSYTVAAWVRLAAKGSHHQTVLTQLGSVQSAFSIFWDTNADRWVFSLPSADSATPTWQFVMSGATPPVGSWVHLAGVYDQGSGTVKLYVNGVLQGTLGGVTTWNATGVLRIGDGRASGGVAAFNGDIDDVRTFRGALSGAQIAYLASI